jgi:putative aldouronate transport system substrate-binding protein
MRPEGKRPPHRAFAGRLVASEVIALSVGLTLSACSVGLNPFGIGSGSGNASSPGAGADREAANRVWELGSEPLKFTFFGNYDWYTMPEWGADDASAWIRTHKLVQVKAINSGGNSEQKLSSLIESGDLPDVIWMERGAAVEKLRAAGKLVPFDNYLDKYTNLKEWLGEAGLNMLRSPDGLIYQFPNWYTNQPNGNAGYVLNKKIYEALGMPKLETTDDLYAYLKLVKNTYPGIIPFEPGLAKDGHGIGVLITAFAENYSKDQLSIRGVKNGDELTSIFKDPTFREGLLYGSKLFREKLMAQDAFTQTKERLKEKVLSGEVAVFAAASPTELAQEGHVALTKKDKDAGYMMIWPIHKPGLDKDKITVGTYTQLGWNVSVITEEAKDPEKIFAFLDWYTGPEGQRILMWGPEGKYWDGVEPDGTPKFTKAYTEDAEGLTELQSKTIDLMWNGNTVYVDRSKAKYESTLPPEQRNWSTNVQYEITWKTQADGTEFLNLSPDPDSELGMIDQRVADIYAQTVVKVILAGSDEQALQILDQADLRARDAGYELLLEYKTQRWQGNLAKLKANNE